MCKLKHELVSNIMNAITGQRYKLYEIGNIFFQVELSKLRAIFPRSKNMGLAPQTQNIKELLKR